MRIPTSGHQPTSQPARTGHPGPPPVATSTASPEAVAGHRLAIRSTGFGAAEVLLNGQDVANSLQGLTLDMGVGKVPTAVLDLVLYDVTEVQDAETRILIPDATRDALTALGWTAPPEPGAEPTGDLDIMEFLVVHRYRRDHGGWAWSWRCWGDGACDGWLALDLSDRPYAERKAREHLATEHSAVAPIKEG